MFPRQSFHDKEKPVQVGLGTIRLKVLIWFLKSGVVPPYTAGETSFDR